MGGVRGATWGGVETVFCPAEVWADEGIYGFQHARWDTQADGGFGLCGWGCSVRPPKYQGQVRMMISFSFTSSHSLLSACNIQGQERFLTQGQN